MDIFEELVTESQKLVEVASKIQDGTNIGLPSEQIEEFIQKYRNWYAECLSVLPNDRQNDFRNEYTGNEFAPQIREFLEAPTEIRVPSRLDVQEDALDDMRDTLMDYMYSRFGVRSVSSSPLASKPSCPYWKYPYKETFYRYLLNQQQILLEVSKIQPKQQNTESEEGKLFDSRNFHEEIKKYARSHFTQREYPAAVFLCCKGFERHVQIRAKSDLSGARLMREVLSSQSGSLGLSTLQTPALKDEQEELMYLCKGLMSAFCNPGDHEPALNRPMTKEDALDILSFISFLYRQVDKMQYVGIIQQPTARQRVGDTGIHLIK